MEKINAALLTRLTNIETLLLHFGYFDRMVLRDLHGLGGAQVTRDIANYKSLAPFNLVYDAKTKKYVKLPGFRKVLNP